MAKFCTTTIAVGLLCLFTLSIAGALPENDESTTQVSLPLSDAANLALRLPVEPVVNTETDSNSALPLTKITFRPVNRRFSVRSKRPCRHHFRFYPAMRENHQIPYGNDMLLPTGENSDFQEPVVHGEGRRVPGRWVRMHHHHHHHHDDEDSASDDDEDDRLKKIVFKRYGYDRFDREKRLRKHFWEEKVEDKKKGGFMKRVRKFLDHYI